MLPLEHPIGEYVYIECVALSGKEAPMADGGDHGGVIRA